VVLITASQPRLWRLQRILLTAGVQTWVLRRSTLHPFGAGPCFQSQSGNQSPRKPSSTGNRRRILNSPAASSCLRKSRMTCRGSAGASKPPSDPARWQPSIVTLAKAPSLLGRRWESGQLSDRENYRVPTGLPRPLRAGQFNSVCPPSKAMSRTPARRIESL